MLCLVKLMALLIIQARSKFMWLGRDNVIMIIQEDHRWILLLLLVQSINSIYSFKTLGPITYFKKSFKHQIISITQICLMAGFFIVLCRVVNVDKVVVYILHLAFWKPVHWLKFQPEPLYLNLPFIHTPIKQWYLE